MNANVKNILESILERFKIGDIPTAVAFSLLPTADVPSAKWSLLNRTLMFLAGTKDARGIRQWNQANRYIKKGAKAFYILVPCFRKVEDAQTGKTEEVLSGFRSRPVFRVEDTEGAALDYEQLTVPQDLPLLERAKEWGISVKALPGNYRYYGRYCPDKKEIGLATQEECVFFHELSHAAHEKLKGDIKVGQDPYQEIVAEMSAQALCRLVGRQPHDTLGNSYRYIERYAKELNQSPYTACLKVMAEAEGVLRLIL